MESFIPKLEAVIDERLTGENPDSYTFRLAQRGTSRVAQKVGEEAVEVALSAVTDEANTIEEAADLMFHLLLLLRLTGHCWDDLEKVLAERHENATRS